jgi:hypothetical protein
MNTNYLKSFALTVVALFLAALAAPAFQEAALQQASTQDSLQIAELFKQARVESAQLQRDSEELVRFHKTLLSWESHAQQVQAIKEHVNKVGELEQQLRDARESGSAWQQEAIDRINPLLKELADNLTSTINHLNEHKSALFASPYPEYVKANAELAVKLHTMISDFVDYGQTKQAFQELQNRLELEKAN